MMQTIPGYTLLEPLGRGGMGVVHRARDERLQRDVALKVLRPGQLVFDGAREGFQSEIEAAGRLSHPGIAAVLGWGEEAGVPWYTQELVPGASLDALLARLPAKPASALRGEDLRDALEQCTPGAPPSFDQAFFAQDYPALCLSIVRQVAAALAHAHERGVLHCDVKPSNIVLAPEGRAVLVDFGVARTMDPSTSAVGLEPAASIAYCAPEILDGASPATDPRIDVYALGVTLYELACRRSPFASPTVEQLRGRILAGDCAPLRERNGAFSRDAAVVCHTALARTSEDRYGSAGALAADLERVLTHRPIQARAPSAVRRIQRWCQRRPGRAASALAAFFGLVVLPGVLATQRLEAQDELRAVRSELRAALAERRRHAARVSSAVAFAADLVHDPRFDSAAGMQDARRRVLEAALRVASETAAADPTDPGLAAECGRLEELLGR